MAERRHGGRRGDARGGGRGGGRGDLPNEEAARQRDLRDIENDDLRQQVRDLQRDIENGDLRQQVRDLQRRLARLEERRGKSNSMSSNVQRRSMDDPLFSDVFTSSDADEPSKNSNSNIFSMPVYDTPVYDEDIFFELPEPPKNSNNNILSMPVYDKPVYDEDILSMLVYDKPVYDEVIFYELPGLVSKFPPPSVKFDDAAKDEGVAVDDDEELEEIVAMPPREVTDVGIFYFPADVDLLKGNKCTKVFSNDLHRTMENSETFVKVLRSMVLEDVLPVWTHPQFHECNYVFNIFKHVFSGVEVKSVGTNVGSAGPTPTKTTISTIVEMGSQGLKQKRL